MDWPYATDTHYIPRDFLEQMDSQQVPQTQQQLINLTLNDTDQNNEHPEWNFGGGANYLVTFHNEYELVEKKPTTEVSVVDNPWQIVVMKSGGNVLTPGPQSNWNPTVYYENNAQNDYSVNGAVWIISGGVTHSVGTTEGSSLGVGTKNVPSGQVGVVYRRRHLLHNPFTYNKYTVSGIVYDGYDENGKGNPFQDSVIRSAGWPGDMNDWIGKIIVYLPDENFLETVNHD